MLIPLLVCFILVDNLRLAFKELAEKPAKTFKSPRSSLRSSLLKSNKSASHPSSHLSSRSHKQALEVLLSSLLSMPFARKTQSKHSPNQTKLNQLDKKLGKSNKAIWTLVSCFAFVLFVRLAAHGGTLSVQFNALDQIQSMLQESGDRFQDTASSNVASHTITDFDATQPASANRPEDRKTRRKFNSLSAFLTSAYVIAYNFWLLFYPDRLSCDWSFGSLAPVLHLADVRNLFSFALLVGLGLVPFLKCLNFNRPSRVVVS